MTSSVASNEFELEIRQSLADSIAENRRKSFCALEKAAVPLERVLTILLIMVRETLCQLNILQFCKIFELLMFFDLQRSTKDSSVTYRLVSSRYLWWLIAMDKVLQFDSSQLIWITHCLFLHPITFSLSFEFSRCLQMIKRLARQQVAAKVFCNFKWSVE